MVNSHAEHPPTPHARLPLVLPAGVASPRIRPAVTGVAGGLPAPPGTLCSPQTGHLRMMAASLSFDAKDENVRAMIEFGKTYQLS